MEVWIAPFNKNEKLMSLKYVSRSIGDVQLHCPGIHRNADGLKAVSVSALYMVQVSIAANGETTLFLM